jgi:hypothetical protein
MRLLVPVTRDSISTRFLGQLGFFCFQALSCEPVRVGPTPRFAASRWEWRQENTAGLGPGSGLDQWMPRIGRGRMQNAAIVSALLVASLFACLSCPFFQQRRVDRPRLWVRLTLLNAELNLQTSGALCAHNDREAQAWNGLEL